MAGLKKTRRIQLISLGFLAMAVAFVIVYFAAGQAFQYFYSPSDLASAPPPNGRVIRIGGLVEEGSMQIDGETVHFTVTDGGATLDVSFTGIRPDLFREGQGTIATGTLENGTFIATEILAKHDEDYLPKEVADALKKQGVFKADGS